MNLLKGARDVYVGKGKKFEHFMLNDLHKNEILARVKGPTGNLRAPALRKGKTLIVGFNEEMYKEALL